MPPVVWGCGLFVQGRSPTTVRCILHSCKYLLMIGAVNMSTQITEFSLEVRERINHYVYRLIDPRNGQTFYIGKGKDDRIFQHSKGVIKLTAEEQESDSEKIKTIRQIHSLGLEVIHIVHRHGMDEKTAFEVEAALIDATPGLTNIQNGYGSNDFGPMHVNELERLYKSEILDVGEEKCLLIKVKQEVVDNFGLYQATRHCWQLNINRVSNVDFAISTVNGIVREVYSIMDWVPVGNRWEFNGTVATEKSSWKFTRIPDIYRRKGMASPCLYINA